MSWCNNSIDHRPHPIETASPLPSPSPSPSSSSVLIANKSTQSSLIRTCPSCGHRIQLEEQGGSGSGTGAGAGAGIQDLPGLPSGVKFDPTDQELLEHLEGKAQHDLQKHHPLIDEFIPTLEGENGICYTHPEKLPGVSRDGLIRHFFHRPSKAYTTGTRKRRKVHTDVQGGETRWHKTGKTRPVLAGGKTKGYKKILVLYTNYGKQKKPEKTNWVMHQYHLGSDEEEKDGELVVSKVFYQTQPRQCGSAGSKDHQIDYQMKSVSKGAADANDANNNNIADYYSSSTHHLMSYSNQGSSSHHLMPNFTVHSGGTSFLQ